MVHDPPIKINVVVFFPILFKTVEGVLSQASSHSATSLQHPCRRN